MAVEITLNDIGLHHGFYNNNFGARFSFQNSPEIRAEYVGKSFTSSTIGNFNGEFHGYQYLYENIHTQIAADASEANTIQVSPVDYIECTIVTDAKPEFRQEWSRDLPGKEPNCVLTQTKNSKSTCLIRRK